MFEKTKDKSREPREGANIRKKISLGLSYAFESSQCLPREFPSTFVAFHEFGEYLVHFGSMRLFCGTQM